MPFRFEGASPFMLNHQQANKFADDWIASWNSRDLEKNLSHYIDDFEMSSPVIVDSMGEPSGKERQIELSGDDRQ